LLIIKYLAIMFQSHPLFSGFLNTPHFVKIGCVSIPIAIPIGPQFAFLKDLL